MLEVAACDVVGMLDSEDIDMSVVSGPAEDVMKSDDCDADS